jgi:hypothetical protein
MIVLLAVNAIPLLVVLMAWWTQRKDRAMPRWRRALFVAALCANTVSSIGLLGYVLGTFSGTLNIETSGRILLMMLPAALISAVLAAFGTRSSRWLLAGNGLLLTVLWVMVGMATSV